MLHRRVAIAAALVLSLLVGPAIAPATAQEGPPGGEGGRRATPLSTTPLTPSETVEGYKSLSSRGAESDPELVARQDAARVPVVIKFDYDGIASYRGASPAFLPPPRVPPASPSRGAPPRAAPTRCTWRAARVRSSRRIQDAVPTAAIGQRLRVVYGGVAARIPANRADDLLQVDGVVAVQTDHLRQLQTDSSTEFVGAPPVWASLGGQAAAGEGIVFGSLDSGTWPEHPSFADDGNLPPAPTDTEGGTIECDFGDNPLTPGTDVFACNDKMVGGHAFIDTYNFVEGGEVYPDSARDSNGHGTHTASTAAGAIVDEAPIFGIDRGPISGMAPGAAIVTYKVCGLEGCFGSDSMAAVEQAIFDGVDVINYSIGGGNNPYSDPVELAFLDAYAAGVFVATSAGNEGPGASTAGHLVELGHHRGRVDPDPRVRFRPHDHRRQRRHVPGPRRLDRHRRPVAAAGRPRQRSCPTTTWAATLPPRPGSSSGRSSPASAAPAACSAPSTPSRAGPRRSSSTTRRWPTSRPTTTSCP